MNFTFNDNIQILFSNSKQRATTDAMVHLFTFNKVPRVSSKPSKLGSRFSINVFFMMLLAEIKQLLLACMATIQVYHLGFWDYRTEILFQTKLFSHRINFKNTAIQSIIYRYPIYYPPALSYLGSPAQHNESESQYSTHAQLHHSTRCSRYCDNIQPHTVASAKPTNFVGI